MATIELADVHKSFGTNHVIRGFSAAVSKGEVVCVIGPSGSGKSTIVGSIGIGMRKGDPDLLKKVNASLAKLKANGTVDKILAKWGL